MIEIYRMDRRAAAFLALLLALALLPAGRALGGETHVAVASNFTAPAEAIARAFEEATGHRAILSFGSTGKLYTQIAHGAPFQVYLAADQRRPEKAVAAGLAVPDSRFTYAVGRLVLYSRDPGRVGDGEATLRDLPPEARLAIANPRTAPYGAAAVQTMKRLGVYEANRSRLVRGENIAQTYQFVATGNAQLGFVALSQVANTTDGSRWRVPPKLHAPIRQQAVLLRNAADSEPARAFMAFLRGDAARTIIRRYGYDLAMGPAS